MNLRAIFLTLLLCCIGVVAEASSKDGYGTDVCTQLVTRANALYNKGKYAEAKVLYEQALATGDKFFAKKCAEQLRVINTLIGGKKKNNGTVFTISQDTVKINYLGGDYPIHVNGENWNASAPESEDWCKIGIDRKSGIVKIYVLPNESTMSRSTFVTIKNGNGQTKTVEVINDGSPEILRSSAQNLMFTPSGETNVVDIDANTDWHIADVPEWLEVIKGSGDIQFTATANDENKDRIAHVKVETPSKQGITINIIQGARLDSLAFSKNDLQFGPDGGDEYIHVLTDAADWRFGDFPHWCQLERIDHNTIRVHCTPNEPVDMPREASVNVTTGNQTLGINVFQSPKPIVHIIPVSGIGGKAVSFGFNIGYSVPMIHASSAGEYTGSVVNYVNAASKENAAYSSASGYKLSAVVDIRIYKNLYLMTGIEYHHYKYSNEYHADGTRNILSGMPDYYFKGRVQDHYKEDYTFNTLEIPILASYRFPVTKNSHIRINAGPVISCGLSAKMKLNGTSDAENLKAYKIDGFGFTDEPYFGAEPRPYHTQANGAMNLYGKNVDYTETYVEGNQAKFDKSQTFDSSPLKRMNFGVRFGVAYEYSGISFGVDYNLMLSNMANKRYWDGNRWAIFDFPGSNLMSGYKQYNHSLQIHIGYTFRY